ncbi:MAG: MotA/TolQ/ExbB proton channel family protein [Leptospiraceae bacterium]|nr:MotA/TolQ/ExbB proton channel family protein [Leptospiraceae bacterium]MCP5497921.1 MotA/TolQ/ExbB proton channel family protein [Leptospiraceae bacterium]
MLNFAGILIEKLFYLKKQRAKVYRINLRSIANWMFLSFSVFGGIVWFVGYKEVYQSVLQNSFQPYISAIYFIIILFYLRVLILVVREVRNSIDFEVDTVILKENASSIVQTQFNEPLELYHKLVQNLEEDKARQIIHQIAQIKINRGSVNRDILEDILDETGLSVNPTIHGYIQSFVLLGLMGTVIGLMLSVYHLQQGFLEPLKARDLKNFYMIFEGMTGAFGTTLVGIIATVVLNITSARAFIFFEQSINRLRETIRVYVLPLFTSDNSETIMTDIRRDFLNMSEKIGYLTDRLMIQSERYELFQSSFSSAVIDFKKASQSYSLTTESIHVVQKEVSDAVSNLQATIYDLNLFVREFRHKFQENFEKQYTVMEHSGDRISGLVKILDKNHQANSQVVGILEHFSTKIQNSFSDLSVAMVNIFNQNAKNMEGQFGVLYRQFEDSNQKILKLVYDRLLEVHDSIDKQLESFVLNSESLKGNIDKASSAYASNTEKISIEIIYKLEKMYRELLEFVTGFVQKNSQGLQNSIDSLNQTIKDLK